MRWGESHGTEIFSPLCLALVPLSVVGLTGFACLLRRYEIVGVLITLFLLLVPVLSSYLLTVDAALAVVSIVETVVIGVLILH